MDPLVIAAATALVGAMATDAWETARSAIVRLWRRVHPDRAEAIGGELTEVRGEVLQAREASDTTVEQELTAEWQRRIHRLLQADPSVAEDLQRILADELVPLLPAAERSQVSSIMMKATASGQARVYQAGHDLNITER
jgi:ABC-type cobalamin transport system ATPase subunit